MTGRALALSLLLVGVASAQLNRGSSETASRIRIRISFPDHASCGASMRAALIGNTGFALAETTVRGECVADFYDVPAGRYRVNISGGDAANADDGEIEVGSFMQDVEIHARHAGDPAAESASATFVSVSDLGVPSNAAKEFGKANQMIAKQDWLDATDRLHKAVEMYPHYAAAYNNLGAVYSRLGNWKDARASFEQAIALNDHLVPAYVNLARVDFNEKDFVDAEPLLDKASNLSAAPTADELNLLAYAQLMNHHPDQAIETSHRGHTAQLAHHAFLHLIASHIYEQERKIAECISELQTYLKEEPAAAQSAEVRKALVTLETQQGSSQSAGPS